MNHLKDKFILIRTHLCTKYVQVEKENILRRQQQKSQSVVLQQEAKGASAKTEIKAKEETNVLDPRMYNSLFDQKAAGFITDELPECLIDEFLEFLVTSNLV